MSKATPGPWKVVEREVLEDGSVYPLHIVGGTAEYQVCMMESQNMAQIASEDPNHYWNANAFTGRNALLISAAPDLLEALRRCKFDSLNMSLEDLEFCQAAYTKATGSAS